MNIPFGIDCQAKPLNKGFLKIQQTFMNILTLYVLERLSTFVVMFTDILRPYEISKPQWNI